MSKIGDRARKAGGYASEKIDAAKDAAETALAGSKVRANAAYSASRKKATKAYADAQAGVKRASTRAGKELDDNPLAFLIGGIALGALLGSLLPRTQQEVKTLGSTGLRINKAAGSAAKAAKAAGQKKLDSLGISKTAAKKQAQSLLKSMSAAATDAGTAAAKAVRATPKAKPAARKPAAPKRASAKPAGTPST